MLVELEFHRHGFSCGLGFLYFFLINEELSAGRLRYFSQCTDAFCTSLEFPPMKI